MRIKILFFFVLLNINFYYSIIEAKEINKIIVKIDNELITNYDVKNKIITTLILAKKEINQKNINNLKRKSLEDLIQNRLKKIELKKYNLKRDDRSINSYLNSISSNNIENLKLMFQDKGTDFQVFIDEIDVEMKWRSLIYKIYSSKIEINPEEVERQVERLSQKKEKLIKFNLSEIEILSNNEVSDEKKISEVLNEINDSSFEDAVIKFSVSSTSNNKGQLGWVNSNALPKVLLEYLQDLSAGEISKPIKRQNTIIFLKLNEKEISDFSNINKDKLRKELIEQEKNELISLYSNSFLSRLRNTNFIEYYK